MRSILTVTSAASSYDLTTVPAIKAELGGLTDRRRDRQFAVWIGQASGIVADYCGRVFAKETLEERLWPRAPAIARPDAERVETLQLARWPIVSVVSVSENGTALIEGTDFRAEAASGQLIRLDVAGRPRHWHGAEIVVDYIAGYELVAGLPAPIQRATISVVKRFHSASQRDPLLRKESAAGIYEAQYWFASGPGGDGALTPEEQGLLDPYRIPVIA